jgi:hypothetical protein
LNVWYPGRGIDRGGVDLPHKRVCLARNKPRRCFAARLCFMAIV